MTTILALLSKVQRQMMIGLAISALVVTAAILGGETKVSTEQVVAGVAADRAAFLPGLEEALIFHDQEGVDFILDWLRVRHRLLSVEIAATKPRCPISTSEDKSLILCWSMGTKARAYQLLQNGTYLTFEVPVRFFTNAVALPAALVAFAAFAAFTIMMTMSFKRLSRSLHRPIMDLADAASRGAPFTIQTPIRELQKLAEAVGALRDVERHKAVAAVTQMLTHDIKNSLAVLDLVSFSKSWDEFSGWKGEMTKSIERIRTTLASVGIADAGTLVNPVMDHFEPQHFFMEAINVGQFEGVSITVSAESEAADILFDRLAIERAVVNLTKNAAEAGAKHIVLASKRSASGLTISVQDDGPGVPEQVKSSLFQRGASYGKVGGNGIGLFSVKSIAEAHGGEAQYRRHDRYSIFEIILKVGAADSGYQFEHAAAPKSAVKAVYEQQMVVIKLQDLQRQGLLVEALAAYPLKVCTDLMPGRLPALVYTDDLDLLEDMVEKGVISEVDSHIYPADLVAKKIAQKLRSQPQPRLGEIDS